MTLRTMLMVNALGQLTFAVAQRAVDIMDELEESVEKANKRQAEGDPTMEGLGWNRIVALVGINHISAQNAMLSMMLAFKKKASWRLPS